jgi:hypothetical protein
MWLEARGIWHTFMWLWCHWYVNCCFRRVITLAHFCLYWTLLTGCFCINHSLVHYKALLVGHHLPLLINHSKEVLHLLMSIVRRSKGRVALHMDQDMRRLLLLVLLILCLIYRLLIWVTSEQLDVGNWPIRRDMDHDQWWLLSIYLDSGCITVHCSGHVRRVLEIVHRR